MRRIESTTYELLSNLNDIIIPMMGEYIILLWFGQQQEDQLYLYSVKLYGFLRLLDFRTVW